MEARHVIYSGRVQGVGFRFTVRESCTRHGVRGWVRNLADGTVEAEMIGSIEQIAAAQADIQGQRKHYIDSVRSTPTEVTSTHRARFEIRP